MTLARRALLQGAVGAGAACLCHGPAFAQWPNGATASVRVDAAVPVGGCNLDQRAIAGFLRQFRISENLSTFDQEFTDAEFALLDYFTTCTVAAEDRFGVEPKFGFFEEASGANAFATPARLFGGTEPDGSVLFGKTLLASYTGAGAGMRTAIGVIVAHEYAHILQYKRRRAGRCPQVELEADLLAGWMLGCETHVTRAGVRVGSDPAIAARTMFDKGDTSFSSPNHHGTHQQRMAQVLAGFRMGQQRATLDQAWAAALASTGSA